MYAALDSGNLDLPISLKSSFGLEFSSLRDLVATPLQLQKSILAKDMMKILNAQQYQTTTGYACHEATLANIGNSLIHADCVTRNWH